MSNENKCSELKTNFSLVTSKQNSPPPKKQPITIENSDENQKSKIKGDDKNN